MSEYTTTNTPLGSESEQTQSPRDKSLPKFVLVGNPNVGKSVLFAALTGVYVEVSNYPGTTVDIAQGKTKDAIIIDTPGIYGIGSFNEEERVARDILIKYDRVINIVSAVSLERDLFLTQQLIDMGFSIIVVVNQMDDAKKYGINIDIKELKKHLGVEVFPTIATQKVGIELVKNNLNAVKQGNPVLEIISMSEKFAHTNLSRVEMILALEDDSIIHEKYPQITINPDKEKIYTLRRSHINDIVKSCVTETSAGTSLSTKMGYALLNPFIGFVAAAAVLFLLYQIVGVFVGKTVVDTLQNLISNTYVPWLQGLVGTLSLPVWLNDILVGEFGVLTMTVVYIIAVLLPLVISFYVFFALLEDCGYLPRLAVLTDRFFNRLGLNGKAIIPIILGFGCITMAIISSRVLNSQRERTIAIALLALTIPCSAQLGIIISLLAAAATPWAWIAYLISLFSVLVIVSTVLNKLLPGESSSLILDLPVMRLPLAKNVAKKAMLKTWHFLQEATPLFFLGAFILSILNITGGLIFIQDIFAPIVVSFLDLPREASNAFIMGLIRRDFGAAGLATMAGLAGGTAILSSVQIVVSTVIITLFVPCIAAVLVIFKERGWFEAVILWAASIIIAILTGGVLSFILNQVFGL